MSDIIFFVVLAIFLLFAVRVCIGTWLRWRADDRDAEAREQRRRRDVLESLAPVDWPRRWDV